MSDPKAESLKQAHEFLKKLQSHPKTDTAKLDVLLKEATALKGDKVDE